MGKPYSAKQISEALFQSDPMNTGCKENDCEDEYDMIAQTVMERVDQGGSLPDALYQTLSDSFYDGDPFDFERVVFTLAFINRQ